MLIHLYSLPALIAFLAKAAMLFYWRGGAARDVRARLFVVALLISMSMNVVEFSGLQGYWDNAVDYAGYAYNGLLAGLLAVLAHLTIRIAYEHPPTLVRRWLIPSLYGYLLGLMVLLAASNLVIAGFEQLGGYTITRIPGPLYPLFEVFGVFALLTIVALPIRGIMQKRDGRLRSRCQIWMLAAMPACATVITVLVLLRLNMRWFNATVTLPIPMTLLLAAIGYCVRSKRIFDLSASLPFTGTGQRKQAMHSSVLRATSQSSNLKLLLDRLAASVDCPVALIDRRSVAAASQSAKGLVITAAALREVQETLVVRESNTGLAKTLREQRIGAVVPLFSTSVEARCWLVFGESFDATFYTPADFKVLDTIAKGLAGLLLDRRDQSVRKFSDESRSLKTHESNSEALNLPAAEKMADRPLSEKLADYEAILITQALAACSGNRAKAARLLGLQANTLHYKLKRLRLST